MGNGVIHMVQKHRAYGIKIAVTRGKNQFFIFFAKKFGQFKYFL